MFDAALYAREDGLKGVTESIVVGGRVPVGTGGVQLFSEEDLSSLVQPERKTIIERSVFKRHEL
jgi:hypothetical protein